MKKLKMKGTVIIISPKINPVKNKIFEYTAAFNRPNSSFIIKADLISAIKDLDIPIPIKLTIPFMAIVKPKYCIPSHPVPNTIKTQIHPALKTFFLWNFSHK